MIENDVDGVRVSEALEKACAEYKDWLVENDKELSEENRKIEWKFAEFSENPEHRFYGTRESGNPQPVFVIKGSGEIIWYSPKGEIKIDDHRSLVFAFLDTVMHVRPNLDYSKLDEKAFAEYQAWLDSK